MSRIHCMDNSIPWVEKYRPLCFDDIVLDKMNRRILENVVSMNYFPNLLFYGPPGTGKTTTIINLIRNYQSSPEMIIHLNASDERGIDVIRNQIHSFVNTKSLFSKGLKFVILDEVDYMTKNAQQALGFLMKTSSTDVRYCLICNYISRIDEIQHNFVKIRFNKLPEDEIVNYLRKISVNENLGLSDKTIYSIQKVFGSDIRSMINFMQSNQDLDDFQFNLVDDELLESIFTEENINAKLTELSITHNMDKKTIVKNVFNYVLRKMPVNAQLLSEIETVYHIIDCNQDIYIHYICDKLLRRT